MLTANQIRQQFLDFFRSKGHQIVPSAPIVVKNDPTLLFTNAGMNQFKDYFLGNKAAAHTRVADTQKCLRVSGKHNDLEEVGVDTYHHTMFEMLGNWSFGDYFKKEAIEWSWELLTSVYNLPKDRLYVTVFEGDAKENLPKDEEAYNFWKQHIAEDRILLGNKKDNFWEMGDTGPCGPCSEIHVDCRPDNERAAVDGKTLVNADHPQVIEIWNNVFMQFNRLKDGSLQPLPAKHVDTGMGLERLVRVIQGKTSNYDTDLFTTTISKTEQITGAKYGNTDNKEDVAFRVIADHIRAIAFTIADGQLPSNTGAGYVIRRILRRAVRYYFSYLNYKQPLLHQLMPGLAEQFREVFPELHQQLDFVSKVVKEEEDAFLKTVAKGLEAIDQIKGMYEQIMQDISNSKNIFSDNSNEFDGVYNLNIKAGLLKSLRRPQTDEMFTKDENYYLELIKSIKDFEDAKKILFNELHIISGKSAFILSDTYGFPIDLTRLVVSESGYSIDEKEFERELQQQKDRSRAATALDTDDWVILQADQPSKFVGYDSLEAKASVIKYRKVKAKGKESYQLVLDQTPFYAESGGQVGDSGSLILDSKRVEIFDTKKENDLIIHFAEEIPADLSGTFLASVNVDRRRHTTVHHSATHLLHAALREVLGTHVAQKGSLVNEEHLRFDFSHFAKMTDEEIVKVEAIVNQKIRENVPVVIKEMSKDEAVKMGAMALFGEKYGDVVRVVMMDPSYSIELCGGTHVGNTGELGLFKIKSEGAVAAGVRRIEAVSGKAAEVYINEHLQLLGNVRTLLKNPKDLSKGVESLLQENASLKKQLEALESKILHGMQRELLDKGVSFHMPDNTMGLFIGELVKVSSADALKKLSFDLSKAVNNAIVVLCADVAGKASVAIAIADKVVAEKGLDAGKLIKEKVAPFIKGGGGGQKNLATAGGQDVAQLQHVIDEIKAAL